jgi:hypothetical protein
VFKSVRRFFVTASLLLMIGTLATWARAQWASDELMRAWIVDSGEVPVVRRIVANACRGSATFGSQSYAVSAEAAADARALAMNPPDQLGFVAMHRPPWSYAFGLINGSRDWRGWSFGGFEWARLSHRPTPPGSESLPLGGRSIMLTGVTGTSLTLPWWFLALCFSLAPARAAWRWRRRRRPPENVCTKCGYDVRATADAAGPLLPMCPECGRMSDVATRV